MNKEFDIGEILPAPATYVHCSVCEESYAVDVRELNSYFNANICPRCKNAVLFARRMMENQED